MRTRYTDTDPYRPANAHHPPPPTVVTSLALTVALPLAVYLLAHPVTAVAVVATAVTTATVVARDRQPR